VRNNEVYVNGKKLERDRVPAASLPGSPADIDGHVFSESNAGSRYRIMLAPVPRAIPDFAQRKVPEGTCFVLGDNRNRSSDSREFGFVPLGGIIGLVQYIYLPADGLGRCGAYVD